MVRDHNDFNSGRDTFTANWHQSPDGAVVYMYWNEKNRANRLEVIAMVLVNLFRDMSFAIYAILRVLIVLF